jgi:hypothetical protein
MLLAKLRQPTFCQSLMICSFVKEKQSDRYLYLDTLDSELQEELDGESELR